MLCRMSGDEGNPATVPQPVDDVQGDGRWMSQVGWVFFIPFVIQYVRKRSSMRVKRKINK